MRLFLIGLLATTLCTFEFAVNAADKASVAATPSTVSAKVSAKVSASQPIAPKHRASVKGKQLTKDPAALQMPVSPVRGTAEHTGRLVVMFEEKIAMRAPRTAGTDAYSLLGADTTTTAMLLAKYGCTIRQAIDVDPVKLANLRARAQLRSGKPSPDLASMMYLEGISPSQLVVAGREFLALPDVAWVEIETKTELASPQGCGVPPPTCGFGSTGNAWIACADCGVCAPDGIALPCIYPHPGTLDNGTPAVLVGNCSDIVVCGQVNAVRPSCADCWDEICATFANLLGPSVFGGKGSSDTCLQTILFGGVTPPPPFDCNWNPIEESILITNSPFDMHGLAGSSNADCCRAVCFQDVTCCTIAWDESCAATAIGFYNDCYSTPGLVFAGGASSGSPLNPNIQAPSPLFDEQMLQVPPPVATPNSFALGLYTTAVKYPDPYSGPNPPAPPPTGPLTTFINVTGYRGGGLDLEAMRSLLTQFPGTNGPQLPTITVAVVEPSALVNHEDLINPLTGLSKVIVEAGQTPLVINDKSNPPGTFSGSFYTAPMHGTATLGLLFANENTIGVTGIVPTTIAKFFPTETFQSQGRLLTALTNAIEELSASTTADPNPGNIIVLPISQNGQPLNTTAATAALITTGINAGVTMVLAAGNAAQEVAAPIGGSEAAIVVGGVWPGFQFTSASPEATTYPGLNYCRANLSNFSGTAPATVDVSAWGRGVCTLGYGDLFCGDNTAVSTNPAVAQYESNRLRSYTAVWGGTSAGAAQIAGVAAQLQALAKQVYEGEPLSPENIEAVLTEPENLFAQCGLLPSPIEYSNPQIGDTIDTRSGTEGDPAPVGGFPNVRQAGRAVITGDFYGNNLATFQVVRGTLLSGSQLSIREIDNKFVKIRTERLTTASSGLGPPLYYPTAKRAVDIQVVRTTELQSPQDLTQVSVRVTGQTVSVAQALVLAFIYNYTTNRWNVMPPYLGAMTAAGAAIPQFTLPACVAPSYIGIPTANGVQLAVRIVVIPQGGFGQTQIWFDQIEILYNSPLGDAGAGCGGGGGP